MVQLTHSPERGWQELESLVPKPHLLEQRVTYGAETGQSEGRSVRGHSYAQAPDCGALFDLSATLEPATQDTHERLRGVTQKCAKVPMGCTDIALRMAAATDLHTCTHKSLNCTPRKGYLAGGERGHCTEMVF
jgi:hypothetical protein